MKRKRRKPADCDEVYSYYTLFIKYIWKSKYMYTFIAKETS